MNPRPSPGTSHRITVTRLLSALILLIASMTSNAPAQTDTHPYLWKNRLLLIEAPSVTDPDLQRQSALLLVDFPGLLDRDLIVQTSFGSDTFSLRLIGKDGTEKLQSTSPVEVDRIFLLIDSMPMRKAELRRRVIPQ